MYSASQKESERRSACRRLVSARTATALICLPDVRQALQEFIPFYLFFLNGRNSVDADQSGTIDAWIPTLKVKNKRPSTMGVCLKRSQMVNNDGRSVTVHHSQLGIQYSDGALASWFLWKMVHEKIRSRFETRMRCLLPCPRPTPRTSTPSPNKSPLLSKWNSYNPLE